MRERDSCLLRFREVGCIVKVERVGEVVHVVELLWSITSIIKTIQRRGVISVRAQQINTSFVLVFANASTAFSTQSFPSSSIPLHSEQQTFKITKSNENHKKNQPRDNI